MNATQELIKQELNPGIEQTIIDRLKLYAEQARGAYAPETERAWRSDSKLWFRWCHLNNEIPIPATPSAVAAFVDVMAQSSAPASIRRYVATIASLHKFADMPSPTKETEVILALKRMSREKGTRQKQAKGLNRPIIDHFLDKMNLNCRDVRVSRDMAIISLAYDTLCRRSELAAMDIEDLDLETETILIRKSKTDQSGQGSERFVGPDTILLIKKWLEIAKLTDGPLFVGIDNAGQTLGRISTEGISRAFKRATKTEDGKSLYSSHSCRIGAAQDMAIASLDLGNIMQAGGWKTATMVARYTEKTKARQSASAKLAILQNRL